MRHEHEKSTFVFLYGSWQQPSCWEGVRADLDMQGYRTLAPDMPTEEAGANFEVDARHVADAIQDEDDPIIVGWSRGGNAAVRVASLVPVKKVVFVAASFEPETIDCLLTDATDENMPVRNNLEFQQAIHDLGDGRSIIEHDAAARLIYHDCPEAEREAALSNLRPHRRYGQEPRLETWPVTNKQQEYIIARNDRVIRPEWQEYIASQVLKIKPRFMNTGHAPMLADAHGLSDMLVRIDAGVPESMSVALRQYSAATTYRRQDSLQTASQR